MATLEERAREYSGWNGDETLQHYEGREYDAYIQGARDQRKIDIDKACNEVEDLLYQCKRLGIHSIPQLVEKFRKAIES